MQTVTERKSTDTLKNILAGWRNVVVKDPEIEKLAQARGERSGGHVVPRRSTAVICLSLKYVRYLLTIFDMFGYAWSSAHAHKDSPTLDAVMSAYEELADAIA